MKPFAKSFNVLRSSWRSAFSLGVLSVGVGVAMACTSMQPTPCGTTSTTSTKSPCYSSNTAMGTTVSTTTYNSPSQCAGGFSTGGNDCTGQTNQVACIATTVWSYSGCTAPPPNSGSYSATNLINQTTPGGGSCGGG